MHLPTDQQALLFDRFGRIEGANPDILAQVAVDLIGCGGLGGEVGHGLVRKGIGRLTLCDHDRVDVTNLARQHFHAEEVGQPKAVALARNLERQTTRPTLIQGYAESFQNALEKGIRFEGDVAVVGVDNNPTRLAAARYFLARGVPVLFLAVDVQAACGYVFVQTSKPGDPCFQCRFPDAPEDNQVHGCAGASIEILKITAGMALYALDSLFMDRPRPWNYKTVFLNQGGDGHHTIARRQTCPLCNSIAMDRRQAREAPQREAIHG